MANVDVVLTQRRFSAVELGKAVYKIELSAGSGADPNLYTHTPPVTVQLFVLTLETDKFARVSTIADLDLIPSLRDEAVLESNLEYRSSTVTLTFEDLDTGIAAINVIRDRVDNVVKIWNQARTDFIVVAQEYNLPLEPSEASVEGGLTITYTETRDARIEAETEQGTAQDDFDAAQIDTVCKRSLADAHCDYKDRYTELNGKAGTVKDALSLAIQNLKTASSLLTKSTRVTAFGECDNNAIVTKVLAAGSLGGASPGDFILVRFAATGITELRVISVANANEVSVFNAFSVAPDDDTGPVADTWELRLFSDYIPTTDFGAVSADAVAAQKALDDMLAAGGLTSLITTDLAFSTQECGTSKGALDTALSVENDKSTTLNDKKAAKDAAQSLEDTATSALQDYCPTVDLAKL